MRTESPDRKSRQFHVVLGHRHCIGSKEVRLITSCQLLALQRGAWPGPCQRDSGIRNDDRQRLVLTSFDGWLIKWKSGTNGAGRKEKKRLVRERIGRASHHTHFGLRFSLTRDQRKAPDRGVTGPKMALPSPYPPSAPHFTTRSTFWSSADP